MGRFDGVLLMSDFDNTLVYTETALRSGQDVPDLLPRNREAIEYFIQEGGSFAVATGRALAAFVQYAPQVPMNVPCVVCNGAAMYDFSTEQYLAVEMMGESALQRGQELLNQFPAVAVEAYHIENEIHAVQMNDITRRHEHLTKVKCIECASLMEVPLPLGKLLFEGSHTDLCALKDVLVQKGWSDVYELIFSGSHLLEMTAKGANKGAMVAQLARRLGIDEAHVYCVGDEANDLSMLGIASQGFAPSNCIEAVKQCGATIVCHANDGALADVIGLLKKRYA